MGLLKANYHTHNQLCQHAVGNCEDYVLKAISLNMEEIGLSDHGPIRQHIMTKEEYDENLCYRNMTKEQFYNIYLKEIEDVKSKYSNQISIKAGLECEFVFEEIDFLRELKSHLDYLNLGIHYFKNEQGHIVNSYRQIDYKNVIEYAKCACEAMETKLFKILVHPDLFMFSYKNKNGLREFDENAIIASKMIIESAIKNDIYLEVNVNGLSNSRKYGSSGWLYPCKDFWSLASKYKNLKIVIGVDAHNPEALDSQDLQDVISFTKEMGLNIEKKVKF